VNIFSLSIQVKEMNMPKNKKKLRTYQQKINFQNIRALAFVEWDWIR